MSMTRISILHQNLQLHQALRHLVRLPLGRPQELIQKMIYIPHHHLGPSLRHPKTEQFHPLHHPQLALHLDNPWMFPDLRLELEDLWSLGECQWTLGSLQMM